MGNGRMWTALPAQMAAGLVACVCLWSPASAQQALTPNENLVADGLPPIPASLVEDVRKYSEARTAVLVDWHPVRREVLVSTRFGDAAQLHSVAMPAGARRQLTFYPNRINGGWYQPTPATASSSPRTSAATSSSALSLRPRHRQRRDDHRRQVAKHTPSGRDGNARLRLHPPQRKGQRPLRHRPRQPEDRPVAARARGRRLGPHDWSPTAPLLAANTSRQPELPLADDVTGDKTLITRRAAPKRSPTTRPLRPRRQELYVTTDQGGEFLRFATLSLDTATVQPHGDIKWDVESSTSPTTARSSRSSPTKTASASCIYSTHAAEGRPVDCAPVGVIAGSSGTRTTTTSASPSSLRARRRIAST